MSIGLCEKEETVELLLKSGVVCSYSVIWLGSFGFSRSFLLFRYSFSSEVSIVGRS